MANGNNNHNDWVEAQILEVLNERPGKRMNYKQISSRLGFNSKPDRELAGEALMDLVNKKLIVEQPKGSFGIAILNNCPSTSGFKFKSDVLIA